MGNTITTMNTEMSQSVSYAVSPIDLLNQQDKAKDAWPVSWPWKGNANPPDKADTFEHFSNISLWPLNSCHNRSKLFGFDPRCHSNENFTEFGNVIRSEGSFNIDNEGLLSVNFFMEFPKEQDTPYSWMQPYQREGGGLEIMINKNFSIGVEAGAEHYLNGFNDDMRTGTYPFIGLMFTFQF